MAKDNFFYSHAYTMNHGEPLTQSQADARLADDGASAETEVHLYAKPRPIIVDEPDVAEINVADLFGM